MKDPERGDILRAIEQESARGLRAATPEAVDYTETGRQVVRALYLLNARFEAGDIADPVAYARAIQRLVRLLAPMPVVISRKEPPPNTGNLPLVPVSPR